MADLVGTCPKDFWEEWIAEGDAAGDPETGEEWGWYKGGYSVKTDNIVNFMRLHYSDENLAALLAHAEDGKLAYDSCCCFIGIPTANHALKGERTSANGWSPGMWPDGTQANHHLIVRHQWEFGDEAESEFWALGHTDTERRNNLIPLIRAEILRREALKEPVSPQTEMEEKEMQVV